LEIFHIPAVLTEKTAKRTAGSTKFMYINPQNQDIGVINLLAHGRLTFSFLEKSYLKTFNHKDDYNGGT